jgi:hypothetical protein
LWRDKWIQRAKEWKDKVPSAKLVFDLESNPQKGEAETKDNHQPAQSG